jgi:hypothetical protein
MAEILASEEDLSKLLKLVRESASTNFAAQIKASRLDRAFPTLDWQAWAACENDVQAVEIAGRLRPLLADILEGLNVDANCDRARIADAWAIVLKSFELLKAAAPR